MKYIVSIYVWFIGGITMALILSVNIMLTYIFPHRVYDRVLKIMSRFFFSILFIKVEVEGSDKIEKNKPYIFMPNHSSLFDIPLLEGYIPTFTRGIEAHTQFKWPLYGFAIKRFGNIPIKREDIYSSIKTMRVAENFVKQGNSLVVLPEGHRTTDGKLRPFKKLPFMLAQQVNVDLVPVALCGLYQLKPKGTWIIKPRKIKIKFGEIIPAEKVKSFTVEELRLLTKQEIEKLLGEKH